MPGTGDKHCSNHEIREIHEKGQPGAKGYLAHLHAARAWQAEARPARLYIHSVKTFQFILYFALIREFRVFRVFRG
jgi:hypothetical protein